MSKSEPDLSIQSMAFLTKAKNFIPDFSVSITSCLHIATAPLNPKSLVVLSIFFVTPALIIAWFIGVQAGLAITFCGISAIILLFFAAKGVREIDVATIVPGQRVEIHWSDSNVAWDDISCFGIKKIPRPKNDDSTHFLLLLYLKSGSCALLASSHEKSELSRLLNRIIQYTGVVNKADGNQ